MTMTHNNHAQNSENSLVQAAVSSTDTAANDATDNQNFSCHLKGDNAIDLASILTPYHRPDEQTIVCGALDDEKVQALAKAGVELVINLQPDEELSFDEGAAVIQAGMAYEQLPIDGAADLKQLNILAFDNILRQYHGKKIAMHCSSGSRVGAATALRAGWLRGRKMETAMARGFSYGLTENLEQETHNRLLVPR